MLQFGHHTNMSWILCKSSCMCLIINPSYHTCISFAFGSFPYNITYHFGLPHPTIAHFSHCQCGHTIDDLDFTCVGAHVGVNILQPMILFKISSQLLFWKVEHIYSERFPNFSPTTFNDKLIILSLETTFGP
jgi:hypothetical protein